MRMIIIICIIGTIFISGYILGHHHDVAGESVSGVEEMTEEVQVAKEATDDVEMISVDETRDTPAYAVASVLEGVFSWIAELIVGVLYQLAKLFY